MGTLHWSDLPTPQVGGAWSQPAAVSLLSLAGAGGSRGLSHLAGLGTAVALLPACLGAAHTRKGECMNVFCTCFHVLLQSDAKV